MVLISQLSTNKAIENKPQQSFKNLGRAGIETRGRWVRSANATIVLCSLRSLPNTRNNLIILQSTATATVLRFVVDQSLISLFPSLRQARVWAQLSTRLKSERFISSCSLQRTPVFQIREKRRLCLDSKSKIRASVRFFYSPRFFLMEEWIET